MDVDYVLLSDRNKWYMTSILIGEAKNSLLDFNSEVAKIFF